jgi:hypothetical protein
LISAARGFSNGTRSRTGLPVGHGPIYDQDSWHASAKTRIIVAAMNLPLKMPRNPDDLQCLRQFKLSGQALRSTMRNP